MVRVKVRVQHDAPTAWADGVARVGRPLRARVPPRPTHRLYQRAATAVLVGGIERD